MELGLASNIDKIDVLATAVEGITNVGGVSVEVKEGETYTIPKGYHNGAGTVSGVAGGGNYTLQSKTVTPTKKQQSIVSDEGYYGLSDVVVGAIPDNYQDVTAVTATAGDVLATKKIVDAEGTIVVGTMTNNGDVAVTLDTTTTSYTVPAGYHAGAGAVAVVTEEKSATPTKEAQDITPTAGKVLSKVSVAPIPANFIDTTDATATAGQILSGETAYVNTEKVTGTMVNNGAVSETLTAAKTSYTVPVGYHNGEGRVSIALEDKHVTPTEDEQLVRPSDGKLLEQVTVAAIPGNYINTNDATVDAADILVGEIAYGTDGEGNAVKVEGAMPNNGSVNKVLDATEENQSFTIAEGYHDGTGAVSISLETKTVAPSHNAQTITPTAGKVLGTVTVSAIPEELISTEDGTATAEQILAGATAYVQGEKVEGTMANNGDVTKTMDGITVESVTIPAGYTTGGTISLTSDIADALAAI